MTPYRCEDALCIRRKSFETRAGLNSHIAQKHVHPIIQVSSSTESSDSSTGRSMLLNGSDPIARPWVRLRDEIESPRSTGEIDTRSGSVQNARGAHDDSIIASTSDAGQPQDGLELDHEWVNFDSTVNCSGEDTYTIPGHHYDSFPDSEVEDIASEDDDGDTLQSLREEDLYLTLVFPPKKLYAGLALSSVEEFGKQFPDSLTLLVLPESGFRGCSAAVQNNMELNPSWPFPCRFSAALAHWLVCLNKTSQTQILSLLRILDLIPNFETPFTSLATFYNFVDNTPFGRQDWLNTLINPKDFERDLVESVDRGWLKPITFFHRDVLSCIEELIAREDLAGIMDYKPFRAIHDTEGRLYHEFASGDWWWQEQYNVPIGSTLVPLIIGSDKTNLAIMNGDHQAWPVYLSLGNIRKEARARLNTRTVLLLALLPIPKTTVKKTHKTWAPFGRAYFHHAMAQVFRPIQTFENGMLVRCSDNLYRRIIPRIGAIIGDTPEQTLYTGCLGNRCPVCQVKRDDLGLYADHPLRSQALSTRQRVTIDSDKELAIRGLHRQQPFCLDYSGTDIHTLMVPDILHQLTKCYRDHILRWTTEYMTFHRLNESFTAELEHRLKLMPPYHAMKYFKKGISFKRWQGDESKALMMQFLVAAVNSTLPMEILKVHLHYIDHHYLASLNGHSTHTLKLMGEAWQKVHQWRPIFNEVKTNDRSRGFNLQRHHAVLHYPRAIKRWGALDSLSTSTYESSHKDQVKETYRQSNKQDDHHPQMIQNRERQEALEQQQKFEARQPDFVPLKFVSRHHRANIKARKLQSNTEPETLDQYIQRLDIQLSSDRLYEDSRPYYKSEPMIDESGYHTDGSSVGADLCEDGAGKESAGSRRIRVTSINKLNLINPANNRDRPSANKPQDAYGSLSSEIRLAYQPCKLHKPNSGIALEDIDRILGRSGNLMRDQVLEALYFQINPIDMPRNHKIPANFMNPAHHKDLTIAIHSSAHIISRLGVMEPVEFEESTIRAKIDWYVHSVDSSKSDKETRFDCVFVDAATNRKGLDGMKVGRLAALLRVTKASMQGTPDVYDIAICDFFKPTRPTHSSRTWNTHFYLAEGYGSPKTTWCPVSTDQATGSYGSYIP